MKAKRSCNLIFCSFASCRQTRIFCAWSRGIILSAAVSFVDDDSAKLPQAQMVALKPSTNSETANRSIQLLPTPCRSVPRIVRDASSSLAARTGCIITLCRLGRSRAHFSDVPPHLKARDEFGIARNAANSYRAHALCLVGGRKLSPALLQLIACCFLTLNARLHAPPQIHARSFRPATGLLEPSLKQVAH